MKTLTFSLVAWMLLTSQALAAEKDELQGTWVIEKLEELGKSIGPIKGSLCVFSGDSMTLKDKNGKGAFTRKYKSDPTTSPKHFDFVPSRKGTKTLIEKGIYKIDGDTLTINIADHKSRSASFDSKRGLLMVLKRKKDDKKSK